MTLLAGTRRAEFTRVALAPRCLSALASQTFQQMFNCSARVSDPAVAIDRKSPH